jgi:hypothetical protein
VVIGLGSVCAACAMEGPCVDEARDWPAPTTCVDHQQTQLNHRLPKQAAWVLALLLFTSHVLVTCARRFFFPPHTQKQIMSMVGLELLDLSHNKIEVRSAARMQSHLARPGSLTGRLQPSSSTRRGRRHRSTRSPMRTCVPLSPARAHCDAI